MNKIKDEIKADLNSNFTYLRDSNEKFEASIDRKIKTWLENEKKIYEKLEEVETYLDSKIAIITSKVAETNQIVDQFTRETGEKLSKQETLTRNTCNVLDRIITEQEKSLNYLINGLENNIKAVQNDCVNILIGIHNQINNNRQLTNDVKNLVNEQSKRKSKLVEIEDLKIKYRANKIKLSTQLPPNTIGHSTSSSNA